MRPTIFISHTDSDDVAARRFRLQLSRGLDKQGFDVLLDETRLELGSEWRRKLYLMMLSSHAAIILVSEKALAGTEWMRFEASVLVMLRIASRLAADARGDQLPFRVIPVLLRPVERAQFDGSWLEPLGLDEIQGTSSTASQLVKRLAIELGPLKARLEDTPLRPLRAVIRPWLRSVDADVLRDAGRALGAAAETWRDDELTDRLTAELVTADLGRVLDALELLAPQLPAQARQLPKILSAGWVDPGAAARLPPIATSNRRAVGINASRSQFTVQAYVQRASGRFPAWEIVCVTEPGEGDVDGITREILDAVRNQRVQLTTDDDAMAYIERAARRQPFVVAVRANPEAQTVAALTARFPSATFIFLSGGAIPPDSEQIVEFLRPPLDGDREQKAFLDWVEAEGIFDRAGAGG